MTESGAEGTQGPSPSELARIADACARFEAAWGRGERPSIEESLAAAGPDDVVYADPPYLGRHADYHDRWTDADADELAAALRALPCGFAMSTWIGNRFRRNEHLARWFPGHAVRSQAHFYHLGAAESLRHPIEEGLVLGPLRTD